jgi:hypothetical protein
MTLGQARMAYPEGNRFAISSPDDQQAWIWIFSLLSFIYSAVILALRTVLKLHHRGADDIALEIAYVSPVLRDIVDTYVD